MSDYRFPYKDAAFLLNELLDFDSFCEEAGLEEVNTELGLAILEEAGRFGSEVLAPLNTVGDELGAKLTDVGVEETPGFADVYRQYVDTGWPSLAGPEEYGGQGMPRVLAAGTTEIWYAACAAFSLCPMLTTGAVEALVKHGSKQMQDAYLPNLISGEWTGTMCLTEPAAGSDLAAVACKAVPEGDHYLLTGQKIYITWGDHQMTDNVIHMVLARLPDAPPGVKGISMFLVPKFLVNDDGSIGERNDVHAVGIEHKLGIHASPTVTLNFGDNGGAVAYLVGEPHQGLMAMFTMMNDARQGVGIQGLGVAERSYQQAAEYAKERLQGTRKDGSRYTIINFPDVRRMLMTMKAGTEAARGLVYVAGLEIDKISAAKSPEEAAKHDARTGVYTPIVKGWITEFAQELTYHGLQVHGGAGYIEETGSAQHVRDERIMTIYEGTTGIQGLDLAGRKTVMDKGAAVTALLDEIQADAARIADVESLAGMAAQLADATEAGRKATAWLLENAMQDRNAIGSASVNYMMLMGFLCGGWVMANSALKAAHLLEGGASDTGFLEAKMVTARFYFDHLLPRVGAYLAAITAGSDSMMALPEDQF
ncbi:MAG: acyl-CoA dehydrogenase C-terminal domain-containing protein [Lysobacterales bacterium]|jgi:alkylation response protein AidB-like acyl-CoA dehydrogenase